MQEALKYFLDIDDPRSLRNQKHPLIMLIGTTLLASLAGIDSFSGFADFTEAHYEKLVEYFDFPYGCPSHDTYQRLWDAINPSQFYQSFVLFTASLSKLTQTFINLDGKTIRHSGDEKALHIVSAWCHANQLVLAQEKVDSKSNEITALPKLIGLLDLKGRIVTIDAMGAQREICSQIIAQGGDYVISLKGNQGRLHQDVSDYFSDPKLLSESESSEENDKGHGRLEQRIAYSTDNIAWLQKIHEWPGLKSIGVVNSIVEKGDKNHEEHRFYITSLSSNAKLLNQAARAHWGIENQLHWRLDVVFNEDGACIRNDNAAENIDVLRKWALNGLQKCKQKPDQSIKSLMRKNAMSFKHLLDNVKKIFHA
jgi:predicted transposase YbfD/YdcC